MKRKKPELTLTVEPILEWSRKVGWDLYRVESQAVFHPEAGCYLNSQVREGNPDICGTIPLEISGFGLVGVSACIECKAPNRRGTLRTAQRKVLVQCIETGAFAVVVDSLDCLLDYWNQWKVSHDRKKLLLSLLPPIRKRRSEKAPTDLSALSSI